MSSRNVYLYAAAGMAIFIALTGLIVYYVYYSSDSIPIIPIINPTTSTRQGFDVEVAPNSTGRIFFYNTTEFPVDMTKRADNSAKVYVNGKLTGSMIGFYNNPRVPKNPSAQGPQGWTVGFDGVSLNLKKGDLVRTEITTTDIKGTITHNILQFIVTVTPINGSTLY